MANLVKEYDKILDLGCIQSLNPFLENREIIGLDLVSGEATSNYSAIISGNVLDLPDPFGQNSFDAIVAGELLEHVECPIKLLQGLYKTLSNGGLLVLSTPNPNSFIERILTLNLSRKLFYTNEHICLYPQRWLIRLMELSGFSDVKLYSGGFPMPPFGLIPFPRPWCYQTIATGKKIQ